MWLQHNWWCFCLRIVNCLAFRFCKLFFLPFSRIILYTFNHTSPFFSYTESKERWWVAAEYFSLIKIKWSLKIFLMMSCSWILQFDQEANNVWRFCLAIIKVYIGWLKNVIFKTFSELYYLWSKWYECYDVATIIFVFIYCNAHVSYPLLYL
jgi:hypothetical protein